jgi:hypothetical protein
MKKLLKHILVGGVLGTLAFTIGAPLWAAVMFACVFGELLILRP